MQNTKLKMPFVTGDKVSVISAQGKLSDATVLSCSSRDTEAKDAKWEVIIWLDHAKEIQTVCIGSYTSMILEHTLDLDV